METQNNQAAGAQAAAKPQGSMDALEAFFDTYLHKKVPFHLPPHVKELIVKFSPYISLILALIALPIVLAAFGLGLAMTPVFILASASLGMMYYIQVALTGVALVMEIIAFPSLQKRHLSGWKLMYYAALLQAVGNLLAMNLVGLVLGLVISMYFLFQVREYYK